MSASVVFATNRATVSQIAEHLSRCDDTFVPPLSSRTDIGAYARKIGEHAECFEAWASGTLVGLVAAYCNDAERLGAYVTSVSVEPGFWGSGIASGLMARCIESMTRKGFVRIELEVDVANDAAIALYARHGFSIQDSRGRTVVMSLECGTD
jgi:ribosomal protein S18 acetylase RimI-like enzyme